MPDRSHHSAKVTAYFCQRFDLNGFFSLNSAISVHKIVPEDSEVFISVGKGDLKGLLQLLNEGKASLRDCDPYGRSLLSVSPGVRII